MKKTCTDCGIEKNIKDIWIFGRKIKCTSCFISRYKPPKSTDQKQVSPTLKMRNKYRGLISKYIKLEMVSEDNPVYKMVGCQPSDLRLHISSKFLEGMTWDNYGFYTWHMDHIIPLSSVEDESEIIRLCNYANLQPLWAEDNYNKGSKIINNL